jgi:hypothetical protein
MREDGQKMGMNIWKEGIGRENEEREEEQKGLTPSITSAEPTQTHQVEGCFRNERMRGKTGTGFFGGRFRGRIIMLAMTSMLA